MQKSRIKTPKPLRIGDYIGIIATARKISIGEIVPAIHMLESWGLRVKLGKHLFNETDQFAGTDEERAYDLQSMLNDDNVRAILCARGGYGTVRLLDKVDFSRFAKHPKWLAGFSDVSVLHSHIQTLMGVETIHSCMGIDFSKLETNATSSLRKILFGEKLSYQLPPHSLNKIGRSTGKLIGGNLSILQSLRGTPSDLNMTDCILFIEDTDEYLYHIDRMIMNLKHGKRLSNIMGLIVGGMTNMHDNQRPFGKSAEQIILDAVKEYNFPVCFGFPAGHLKTENKAFILGREISLEVTTEGSNIQWKATQSS